MDACISLLSGKKDRRRTSREADIVADLRVIEINVRLIIILDIPDLSPEIGGV
jgi:hypothetical protein